MFSPILTGLGHVGRVFFSRDVVLGGKLLLWGKKM